MNKREEFKKHPITGFIEYSRSRENQLINRRKLERKNSSSHLKPLE